jgi:hypothetical protein
VQIIQETVDSTARNQFERVHFEIAQTMVLKASARNQSIRQVLE